MNYSLQEFKTILFQLIVDVNHLLLVQNNQVRVTIARFQHAALLQIIYILHGHTNPLELIFTLNNNEAVVSIAADAYTQLHCILLCCAPIDPQ